MKAKKNYVIILNIKKTFSINEEHPFPLYMLFFIGKNHRTSSSLIFRKEIHFLKVQSKYMNINFK